MLLYIYLFDTPTHTLTLTNFCCVLGSSDTFDKGKGRAGKLQFYSRALLLRS